MEPDLAEGGRIGPMGTVPITYLAGGLLGDLINQLSVIQEVYKSTRRKGFLYVSNRGHAFRFGLEQVYKDTKDIIKAQEYIFEYKIHTGEVYDVDLTKWRESPLLYQKSWPEIFQSTYNIPWGKHKWLTWKIDSAFQDKVIICYSARRENKQINYKELLKQFPADKVLFATSDIEEYAFFSELSGTNIPLHICPTLESLITTINSCALLIGNLSAPLQYAIACHKPCVGILVPGLQDNIHMANFPDYMNFYQAII
jgi:ADP-heptose:LPS heptosyltransferase